tara:strand:+ start:133 stop:918 length:786 start_codon:yes stop_codon:yes gene_type:complete
MDRQTAPLEPPPQRTFRLLLEYDGSDFAGWQIQARGRTVQGELARALEIFFEEPICPVGSGRTDAGTHAQGQVAHFAVRSDQPNYHILRSINGLLPKDIAVLELAETNADFHARYSATGKRYRYRIHLGKSALYRKQAWTLYHSLDLAVMQKAASALPGAHSFAAFCKQDPVPDSFICNVTSCAWQQLDRQLIFEIEANRFLRHMVRILVGTMAEIGRGQRPVEDMARLLDSGKRESAGVTAPACGLCLLWVRYAESQGGE